MDMIFETVIEAYMCLQKTRILKNNRKHDLQETKGIHIDVLLSLVDD
jgi:hypothetical protein